MPLFVVSSLEYTNEEEASHLVIRADSEAEAREIAAEADEETFGSHAELFVNELSVFGESGVLEEFRRPI